MNGELAIRAAELSELAYASDKEIASNLRPRHDNELRPFCNGAVRGFVFRENKIVWTVFQGTNPKQIKSWIIDLDARKIPAEYVAEHKGNRFSIHKGFYDAYLSVKRDIIHSYRGLSEPRDQFKVTGHSQGAALAVCSTLFGFNGTGVKPETFLFGCPRVGDKKFAKIYNKYQGENTYRFVNNNDVVCRMPLGLSEWVHRFIPVLRWLPMGFRHVGQFLYFNRFGRLQDVSKWELFKDRFKGRFAFCHWLTDGLRDHSGTYAKLTRENFGK